MKRIEFMNKCFCQILPPHIHQKLADNGTPLQRVRALRNLYFSEKLRQQRRDESAKAANSRQMYRIIYDANRAEKLPGKLVRKEGGASVRDRAVKESYDGFGATYNFFSTVFGRASIDDDNMRLRGTVHFGVEYDNAFWDGQQMVFGDGDGEFFNGFTRSLDVIGHELTHGITEDEAALIYSDEPGALNESISDVFGSLVKQYVLKQTAAQADWLIGAELFTKKIRTGKPGRAAALRSLAEPGTGFSDLLLGKDPQPAHFSKYVYTWEDNGGVHINSGIPNRAFYFTAAQLGGYAWEKAGKIWYATLRDAALRQNSSFKSFAQLTARNAVKLFDRETGTVVKTAWRAVGVNVA